MTAIDERSQDSALENQGAPQNLYEGEKKKGGVRCR